jgi:hypothetical protein
VIAEDGAHITFTLPMWRRLDSADGNERTLQRVEHPESIKFKAAS